MTNNANPAPSPFDPASLRLSQFFGDTVGVKKLLTTLPVRKPGRQDFVRVHPDLKYRLTPAATIEVKEDREVYLVTPRMAQALPGEFSTVTLFSTFACPPGLSWSNVRPEESRIVTWSAFCSL